MKTSLEGRVAAVTGGASGIGLECVRQLAQHGAIPYILDRDRTAIEKARDELGGQVRGLEVDLLRYETIDAAVATILDEQGRIDIMHANAGSYVGGNVWEGDPDVWEGMLRLNINAVFRSARAVMPSMMARKSGDILITSSVAGVVPVVAEPIYTASKHAVQAFVHTVRRQLAPHGVRVGAVLPGLAVTPLLKDWDPQRLRSYVDAGATLNPSDIAEAVMFMLSRRQGTVVRDLVILPHGFDI